MMAPEPISSKRIAVTVVGAAMLVVPGRRP